MNNLKFRTVLGVCDPKKFKHDILVFTRGATATITYDLNNKFYNLDFIDQITFLFKQGINTLCFNMFNYLRKTEDTEADGEKVYYTSIQPVAEDSLQVTATPVVGYVGNPKTAGYYEICSIEDGEDALYWMLDEHFFLLDKVLTFTMFPEETRELALTTPMNNMRFEIVFRLDTDSEAVNSYRDSIIIEPQHPIAVVDSLYSHVIDGNDLTVSIRPGSLASTNKTVKE
jgi:hypothetical protein